MQWGNGNNNHVQTYIHTTTLTYIYTHTKNTCFRTYINIAFYTNLYVNTIHQYTLDGQVDKHTDVYIQSTYIK